MLTQARQKAEEAQRLRPDEPSYNLACINALERRLDEAFDGLEACLEASAIAWGHVSTDHDWDGLRDDPRYRELETRYAPPSGNSG